MDEYTAPLSIQGVSDTVEALRPPVRVEFPGVEIPDLVRGSRGGERGLEGLGHGGPRHPGDGRVRGEREEPGESSGSFPPALAPSSFPKQAPSVRAKITNRNDSNRFRLMGTLLSALRTRGEGEYQTASWVVSSARTVDCRRSAPTRLLLIPEPANLFCPPEVQFRGEVREWLNRAVLETVEPPGSEGSNPSLSAIGWQRGASASGPGRPSARSAGCRGGARARSATRPPSPPDEGNSGSYPLEPEEARRPGMSWRSVASATTLPPSPLAAPPRALHCEQCAPGEHARLAVDPCSRTSCTRVATPRPRPDAESHPAGVMRDGRTCVRRFSRGIMANSVYPGTHARDFIAILVHPGEHNQRFIASRV